jgi:toxin ParE1/3/4
VRRLIFRTAASSDIRAIARYTRTRWGEEQTAAYVAALRDQIKSLREYPMRFREFGDRYPNLRQMGCGHHIVFYLVTNDAIEIVRVLHKAMDAFALFED